MSSSTISVSNRELIFQNENFNMDLLLDELCDNNLNRLVLHNCVVTRDLYKIIEFLITERGLLGLELDNIEIENTSDCAISIQDDMIFDLFDVLIKHKSLVDLTLCGPFIDLDQMIDSIKQLFDNNDNLIYICFDANTITLDFVNAFHEIVSKNTKLEALMFSNCHFNENVINSIGKLYSNANKLNYLNIEHCNIKKDKLLDLFKFLSQSKTLETLVLSDLGLNDELAKTFYNIFMSTCISLKELTIIDNVITDIGANKLLKLAEFIKIVSIRSINITKPRYYRPDYL